MKKTLILLLIIIIHFAFTMGGIWWVDLPWWQPVVNWIWIAITLLGLVYIQIKAHKNYKEEKSSANGLMWFLAILYGLVYMAYYIIGTFFFAFQQ